MLLSLQVRDFAIVDQIDIEFAAGMTVLTGETGAGKSILIDALGLVLGERGNAKLVRNGAKRAEFAASFDTTQLSAVRLWLEERSLDLDDDCLLRRVINADGRSRAFVNGNSVPVSLLKDLGERLLDIHGQHFHQSLTKPSVQRDLLDHFGGLDEAVASTRQAYTTWQQIADRLDRLAGSDADVTSRLDLVRFQLDELIAIDTYAGEYGDLMSERQKLRHAVRLAEGASLALDVLMDREAANANSAIAEAERALQSIAEIDNDIHAILKPLGSAAIQVAETADALRRYTETLDADPERSHWVEERLDTLQSIARKHRVDADELPALRSRLEAERDELENTDILSAELAAKETEYRDVFLRHARRLSDSRKTTAEKFAQEVSDAMSGLGMAGGKFEVDIVQLDDRFSTSYGLDRIEFKISANPGQPVQALAKIASGGELSRMSLAVQVIASDGSDIPTMIFDEVDSGVGGGVAEMVGRRLQELANTRQVLCVTHLPQVASLADQHFRINKVSDGKNTRTTVSALTDEERVDELARMLGGVNITQKTREHAAEMLAGGSLKKEFGATG